MVTKKQPKDLTKAWLQDFKEKSAIVNDIVWPSTKYQNDPAAFAIEILGIEPWGKQVEILNSIRDHKRVAVKSGHKIGKSNCAAIIAIWFYCSFNDARVILSSATARQIRDVLWREISKLYKKAKQKIGGNLHELPSSGLTSEDFREIKGFTSKDPEGFAGTSGANILYIFDEASGIDDLIYQAADGNRAAGAKIVLFSNPTKLSGEFHQAFTKKKHLYKCITVSSEETPNVIQGIEVIPGLACRDWVEEKKLEWGEESPLYQVRVKGNFPNADQCTIVPLWLVEQSIENGRSADLKDKRYQGKLHIGVDVARFGDDFSVICFRRGLNVQRLIKKNGLNTTQLVRLIEKSYTETRNDREVKPTIYIDVIGVGGGVADQIDRKKFDVIEVNVAKRANNPKEYVRLRDELWFNIADWLKSGPCILPDDDDLAAELTCPLYFFDAQGRRQVESKDEIKKKIHRSPDSADALGLTLCNENFSIVSGSFEEEFEYIPSFQTNIYNDRMNPYDNQISPYSS